MSHSNIQFRKGILRLWAVLSLFWILFAGWIVTGDYSSDLIAVYQVPTKVAIKKEIVENLRKWTNDDHRNHVPILSIRNLTLRRDIQCVRRHFERFDQAIESLEQETFESEIGKKREMVKRFVRHDKTLEDCNYVIYIIDDWGEISTITIDASTNIDTLADMFRDELKVGLLEQWIHGKLVYVFGIILFPPIALILLGLLISWISKGFYPIRKA